MVKYKSAVDLNRHILISLLDGIKISIKMVTVTVQIYSV